MKRDRYVSDYDRVRREAGMARPEFPEPEKSKPRAAVRDEEFRARMAAQSEADAKAAAEAKARVDAMTMRANQSALLAEYEMAGVAPPFTDGHGVPTVSLSMLARLGWRIEMVDHQNVLVKP